MYKYLIFVIMIIILSCNRRLTEPRNISISGSVLIQGKTDYSGINVALYNLVPLDTFLVNANKKFPSIGFKISQASEFDFRLADPLYETKTAEDGFFIFNDIPEGKYNLVAEKDGFGWMNVYEVDETKELDDLVLYPEMRVAGLLDRYTEWQAGQHVIITGDLTVPEGGTLLIGKGVVVRFDGYYNLECFGQFLCHGEPDELVLFTVNSRILNSSWNSILIEKSRYENVLENVKIEKSRIGLKCLQSSIGLNFSIFQNIEQEGVLVGNNSTASIYNCNFSDCRENIHIEGESETAITNNILFKSYNNSESCIGIYANASYVEIFDNYISNCDIGSKTEFIRKASLSYNYISNCITGIFHYTNYIFLNSDVAITYNTVKNCANIALLLEDTNPGIHKNNILQPINTIFLKAQGKKNLYNIDASNNYWGDLDVTGIGQRIIDERVDNLGNTGNWEIVYQPVQTSYIEEAGPREE